MASVDWYDPAEAEDELYTGELVSARCPVCYMTYECPVVDDGDEGEVVGIVTVECPHCVINFTVEVT